MASPLLLVWQPLPLPCKIPLDKRLNRGFAWFDPAQELCRVFESSPSSYPGSGNGADQRKCSAHSHHQARQPSVMTHWLFFGTWLIGFQETAMPSAARFWRKAFRIH